MTDSRLRPEERYLQRKLAELAEVESLLAQRELELHTLRGSLLTFEKQYEVAVGEKYAQLDELRMRIADLNPRAARGVATPHPPTVDPPTRSPARPAPHKTS